MRLIKTRRWERTSCWRVWTRGWWTLCVLFSVVSAANAAPALSLADAVERQDRAAVQALLNDRVNVNLPQPDGATAVHWAAHWDDVQTARQLISAGADVNRANDYSVTPLWLACQNGSATMAAVLLAAGANANATLDSGETMLMRAAWTGNMEVVKSLLAHGADVNANQAGQTALMWAISEEHPDIARVLVENGADIQARSSSGFTPLMFAARVGDIETARLLVTAGANVNDSVPQKKRSRGPVVAATQVVSQNGVRSTFRGSKCLGYAPVCTPGAGAGGPPLLIAMARGHLELAKFLLDHGADPNDSGMGYTVLHWVAGAWGTDIIGPNGIVRGRVQEWDVSAGLKGETKLEIIRLLLAHGADPNARLERVPPRVGSSKESHWGINREGATPFFLAAHAGDPRAMRRLAAAGADPRLGTDENITPLIAAAGLGRIVNENPESDVLEAVKLALELGNDINARNDQGETALHAAAIGRLNTVVQYLVENGADPNPKNVLGQTPLRVAELRRQIGGVIVEEHTTTGDLLRKLGASK